MKAARLEAAARAALLLWTGLTCGYATLCRIPFAWQAFIQPKILPLWLGFSLKHHLLFTAAGMGLSAAALAEREGGGGKALRLWGAVAAAALASFFAWPLAELTPEASAAAIAVAGALPLLTWEILMGARRAGWLSGGAAPGCAGACGRLMGAAGAGVLCAFASLLQQAGGFWSGKPLALVAAASALEHALLFCCAAAALEAGRRLAAAAARPRAALAACEAAAAALALRWALSSLVLDAVDLRGGPFEAAAWAWACAFAAAWAGAALSRAVREASDPVELLLPALGSRASWGGRAAVLAGALAAPGLVRALVGSADWNGLSVLLTTALSWAAAFAALRPARDHGGDKQAAALAGGLMGAAWLCASAAAAWDPSARLRGLGASELMTRAAIVDPSLRLARRAVQWAPATAFFETLRRNTNITRQENISPRRIDLVEGALAQPAEKPLIFIIVVDSLRQDYVGAYNPAVTFTPALDAFARESLVWKTAFTAYGATGLSEPSIWAGSILIHRQYVTPFAPMNSLERLVDGLGYRKLVTMDSIMEALLTKGPELSDLDPGTAGFYTLCESLKRVERGLDETAGRPLFVYTQSQDVHLLSIKRTGGASVTGKAYPGFNAPFASRVETLDACFGNFVAGLKRRGLYDKSLIVLTADHGDSLGEEGRWGHANTIFPEVMRVPLMMHLPKGLAARAKADLKGPAFLIDIAPTLYQLLGQGPPRLDPLLGRPLACLAGKDPAAWRKPEQLVVSSYGPAYGLLSEGRRFFIADGVNFRYYLYDLESDPSGRRNLVTAAATARGEAGILAWLDRLNLFWGRKR